MNVENVPTGEAGGGQAQGRGLSGGTIATIGGVGLLVLFMAQNTKKVDVNFLFWDASLPVWMVILLAAALGALVWFGFGVLRRHRRRKERREERRD